MRALLLADASFAWRERLMLTRLEVGLADEGVEVIRAAPALEHRSALDPGLSRVVVYRPVGLLNTPRAQARALVEGLAEHVPPGEEFPVQVVHAWGDRCWELALESARALGATLALELWSGRTLASIPRFERRCQRAGVPLLWLAPDAPMRDGAQAAPCTAPCRLAPWGVHTLGPARTRAPDPPSLSIALVTSGEETAAALAAVEGAARAATGREGVMIFLDSASVNETDRVWRRAEALGLLDRISVIPDMEARRDLVLKCDILLTPEARGEHRSIVLDAMAAGMNVVALHDPLRRETLNERTAILVAEPTPDAWAVAVHAVLADEGRAAALAHSARQWVKENRTVSAHLAAVLEAYRWTEGRDSIRFEAPPRASAP